MKIQNPEIFKLHAEFCKTIANPKRLMILALLSEKEMSVGEIVEALDGRLANVSQHLRVLRSHQIVRTRKEGQTVYYRLADKRLFEACTLIRSILLDEMKRRGEIAQEVTARSK
ncbi:MAG: metalloregulator ArsR/SmtB family transcription factor [Candidatus Zixiibacteriota bacterium]